MIKEIGDTAIVGCPVNGLTLPAIDSQVPSKDDFCTPMVKVLARLALIAEDCGWEFPQSITPSADPGKVFESQLLGYIDKTYPGLGEILRATIDIHIGREEVQIVIGAVSQLNLYLLKPLVTELEVACPGLGWFVAQTIIDTPRGDLCCYTPRIMTENENNQVFWELSGFTDLAYAQSLVELEIMDGEFETVTQDNLAAFKNEYGAGYGYHQELWPSEILDEVGGHEHLVCRSAKWPSITLDQAQAWLDSNPSHVLTQVVRDACLFHLSEKMSETEFAWEFDVDETRNFGAMAFIAWDNSDGVFLGASNHEQRFMEDGEGVEAIGRYVIAHKDRTPTDKELMSLVLETKTYLERWHLFEKLMNHFPKE